MKGLVILSGGLDSTVALAMAVETWGAHNIAAVSFSYGQKHLKELECARWQAVHYGVPHYVMDIANVFQYDQHCTLLKGNGEVPHGAYSAEEHSTSVPFRNGVMLAIATSVAEQLSLDQVIIGAHEGDSEVVYPDCSNTFISHMNEATTAGTHGHIAVYAPFILNNFTKVEICKWALEHDVAIEHTWSCYEGNEEPCHKCGTCIQREEALAEAKRLLDEEGYMD